MEILRWVFLAGVEHRTTWFLSATTVGICVVVLVAALCAKSVVSRREVKGSSPGSRWSAVRSKVTNIVRKAGFRRSLKDDEGEVSFLCDAEEGGRVSAAAAAATPPLWQKKIIMGERCALPTFSGLILYDEKGNTLPLAARQKTDFR